MIEGREGKRIQVEREEDTANEGERWNGKVR